MCALVLAPIIAFFLIMYGPSPVMGLFFGIAGGAILVTPCALIGFRKLEKTYAIWEHAIMTSNDLTGREDKTGATNYEWMSPVNGSNAALGWAKFLSDDATDELSGIDPQVMVCNLSSNMGALTRKLQTFNYNYVTTAQHLASDGLMGVTVEGHAGDRRKLAPGAAPPTNPMTSACAAPTAVAVALPRPAPSRASAPTAKFCGQCAAKLVPGTKFCVACAAPRVG
jgi:hypothetical protein